MFRVHNAGFKIIRNLFLGLLLINLLVVFLLRVDFISIIVGVISILFLIFVLRFFRYPKRVVVSDDNILVAPADGRVVVVEEVYDEEILKQNCVQVSIFMSVWNVHINWIPIRGVIRYFKYHPGQFLLAREPKSSTLNERTTTMIECNDGKKIVVKQIAGFVARRIETYLTKIGLEVERGEELGFIKFGSRVDILLPIGTEILVQPGMKAIGCITPIAKL